MTRQEMYRQCLMTNANRTTVGFIPAAAAVVGRVLKLEMPHGLEAGWRVESIGQPIAKDAMRLFERQYKKQRSASDIGTKTRRGRVRRS